MLRIIAATLAMSWSLAASVYASENTYQLVRSECLAQLPDQSILTFTVDEFGLKSDIPRMWSDGGYLVGVTNVRKDSQLIFVIMNKDRSFTDAVPASQIKKGMDALPYWLVEDLRNRSGESNSHLLPGKISNDHYLGLNMIGIRDGLLRLNLFGKGSTKSITASCNVVKDVSASKSDATKLLADSILFDFYLAN